MTTTRRGDRPRLTSRLADAGGATLARGTAALAALRPAAKPLHPRGELLPAVLHRTGSPQPTGVPLLDEPGSLPVTVRSSRAVGLPAALPDIFGLALRIGLPDGGEGDLLFATTGLGRLTRFTLTPALRMTGRPMTTLLPYRTATGPVLLAIRARSTTGPAPDPDLPELDLLWARPRGDWLPWGRLQRTAAHGGDPLTSFDPVLCQVPGLDTYDWVRRLREPAYRRARVSRGAPGAAGPG